MTLKKIEKKTVFTIQKRFVSVNTPAPAPRVRLSKMPKGKSAQDKRDIVLDIFHQTKEPWLLKDLEKTASRRGVVSMSVQPTVQSLVDDDLVKVDKVGTLNWYWSFPSEYSTMLENSIEKSCNESSSLSVTISKIQNEIEEEQNKNKENDVAHSNEDRRKAEMALKAAQDENAKLGRELEKHVVSNLELQDKIAKKIDSTRLSCNRWIDNLFVLQTWVNKKSGDKEATKAFFKQQGVDLNSLDYVQ